MSLRPSPPLMRQSDGFIIDPAVYDQSHLAGLRRGIAFFAVLATMVLILTCL